MKRTKSIDKYQKIISFVDNKNGECDLEHIKIPLSSLPKNISKNDDNEINLNKEEMPLLIPPLMEKTWHKRNKDSKKKHCQSVISKEFVNENMSNKIPPFQLDIPQQAKPRKATVTITTETYKYRKHSSDQVDIKSSITSINRELRTFEINIDRNCDIKLDFECLMEGKDPLILTNVIPYERTMSDAVLNSENKVNLIDFSLPVQKTKRTIRKKKKDIDGNILSNQSILDSKEDLPKTLADIQVEANVTVRPMEEGQYIEGCIILPEFGVEGNDPSVGKDDNIAHSPIMFSSNIAKNRSPHLFMNFLIGGENNFRSISHRATEEHNRERNLQGFTCRLSQNGETNELEVKITNESLPLNKKFTKEQSNLTQNDKSPLFSKSSYQDKTFTPSKIEIRESQRIDSYHSDHQIGIITENPQHLKIENEDDIESLTAKSLYADKSDMSVVKIELISSRCSEKRLTPTLTPNEKDSKKELTDKLFSAQDKKGSTTMEAFEEDDGECLKIEYHSLKDFDSVKIGVILDETSPVKKEGTTVTQLPITRKTTNENLKDLSNISKSKLLELIDEPKGKEDSRDVMNQNPLEIQDIEKEVESVKILPDKEIKSENVEIKYQSSEKNLIEKVSKEEKGPAQAPLSQVHDLTRQLTIPHKIEDNRPASITSSIYKKLNLDRNYSEHVSLVSRITELRAITRQYTDSDLNSNINEINIDLEIYEDQEEENTKRSINENEIITKNLSETKVSIGFDLLDPVKVTEFIQGNKADIERNYKPLFVMEESNFNSKDSPLIKTHVSDINKKITSSDFFIKGNVMITAEVLVSNIEEEIQPNELTNEKRKVSTKVSNIELQIVVNEDYASFDEVVVKGSFEGKKSSQESITDNRLIKPDLSKTNVIEGIVVSVDYKSSTGDIVMPYNTGCVEELVVSTLKGQKSVTSLSEQNNKTLAEVDSQYVKITSPKYEVTYSQKMTTSDSSHKASDIHIGGLIEKRSSQNIKIASPEYEIRYSQQKTIAESGVRTFDNQVLMMTEKKDTSSLLIKSSSYQIEINQQRSTTESVKKGICDFVKKNTGENLECRENLDCRENMECKVNLECRENLECKEIDIEKCNDSLTEEEIRTIDLSIKEIMENVTNMLVEKSIDERNENRSPCEGESKEIPTKCFSCDKGSSEKGDDLSDVPIINYTTHSCFNSKAPIKVAHHEEHSHVRLYKSMNPENQYRLTNTSWTKSEIIVPNTGCKRVKHVCPAVNKIYQQESCDILDKMVNTVISDCFSKTEDSMTPFSEQDIPNLEDLIPNIPRKCTQPCDPVYIKQCDIWPPLPCRDDCIPTPYGYKKQRFRCVTNIPRVCNQRIKNHFHAKSLENNTKFIIPKDGIFGRDEDEPKFVNFCCNTCHTWISHGNRDQHMETCTNNNVKKLSITNGKLKLKPRSIKGMPGVVCFICGGRFTTSTISRHEKICQEKWSKCNKLLKKKFRKAEPVKPEIQNGDIAQRVNEQVSLGNVDFTTKDAINEVYYDTSCKNTVNLDN